MKKVGIILVNYNGLKDTIDCVNSINRSDYEDFEIIIIDNASKEDASSLADCKNVFYKKLDDNVGFGVANNIGADIAVKHKDQMILCLNNDTVIEPDTLKKLAENTDDKTITTGAIYYYSDKNSLWYGGGEVSRTKGNFRHKKYCYTRNISFISGCCMMLTIECYKRIGLFDPAYFMYYEDSDYSLKAQLAGYTLKYIYEAKIYHKVGKSIDQTVGLKDYYLTRNRLYILNKYKDYFSRTSILYFAVTRAFQLLKCKMKKQNTDPILDGIRDYRSRITGRRR